jgi:hypothetical protein
LVPGAGLSLCPLGRTCDRRRFWDRFLRFLRFRKGRKLFEKGEFSLMGLGPFAVERDFVFGDEMVEEI